MSNNHQHAHSEHNHHSFKIESLNKIFVICIVLNLGFVFIEAIIGFVYNSLGLLSDAGHNLSDVFRLLLALVAFRLMKTKSTAKFNYVYKKSSILMLVLNSIILLV